MKKAPVLPGRRRVLRGLGLAGALAAGVPVPAHCGEMALLRPYLVTPWEGNPALEPARIAALLEERLGPFTPVAGHLDLSLPTLAESGNSVRLSLAAAVEPGRRETDRVRRMLVVATRNPHPLVLDAGLGELALPRLTTNIRLAESQTVLAYAQLDSGQVWSAQAPIRVTIGACRHLDFRY